MLGQVYTWGFGAFGEGGTGDRQMNITPVVVESLRRVEASAVSAGGRHTLVAGKLERPKKGDRRKDLEKTYAHKRNHAVGRNRGVSLTTQPLTHAHTHTPDEQPLRSARDGWVSPTQRQHRSSSCASLVPRAS